MHEFSLMNKLMNKILAIADQMKGKKVTKVCVKLGALSHMSPSHFKEHFDIAAKGTIAEGALLEAEESKDYSDPDAQAVFLKSIDVE
jgi:hydrogenase nickel incorporation protein HypA/HybF